ncbi:multidrug resistance efflux transporter family protein [Arcobacter sp. HD9-500m-PIT-SAG03]|nr:multidrug resistance efflux transporter family protein [Arcobacter sp. HD9-500m-PIT-SAG03]
MNNNTFKIIFIGLLAALFFSSTFLINRYIAIDGGHWFWSATLRYIYMLIFLVFGFILFKGFDYLKLLISEFFKNCIFWTISGSIGFGIFYASICYVADSSPAWVVATTWQFTIIASLFILHFFGKNISKLTWTLIIVMFIGIFLINLSFITVEDFKGHIFNVFLIIIASFAYPLGNQLVWEVQKGRESLPKIRKDIVKNIFSKVFLLSLGSLPFWLMLSLFFKVGVPSYNQFVCMILVAIFSGITATSLFLYARSKANSPSKIALSDATQSGEVIFTLVIEIIMFGALIPTSIGIFGIGLVLVGLISLTLL